MKIVRFNENRLGISDGQKVIDVTGLFGAGPDEWPPVGMNRLIRDFAQHRGAFERRLQTEAGAPLSSVRLETPVPWPNKLMAYPVNYHDHATEMASKGLASVQGYFLKSNSSLSGPQDPVVLPALGSGREIHHECEIGLIIGKEGRQIAPENALDYVFGYTCLLDMTVRGKEERVFRKSYDSFTPVGPWITTADEVPDVADIDMQLWVNGEPRQKANTRDLIVDIRQMISIASSASTLYPGDIVATGTPAGVDKVVPGDIITIEVANVGRMSVPVVQGELGENIVFAKPYEFVRAH
ncbi:fumarylacetoacetate hydrolase family protein [Cupriavidus lacunae]|uniref:FAA hydrolase family protein n=1 Tax=Cupriavidus lacunae TaxID=2666307 RepID=A0A370NK56_9BURK|nr:fumarylacetoacetate hydrolase family protein [Cupriavidus lacunae]RDK05989.1 FAA hydrolase family protein [Cupriavidus lacunae]